MHIFVFPSSPASPKDIQDQARMNPTEVGTLVIIFTDFTVRDGEMRYWMTGETSVAIILSE